MKKLLFFTEFKFKTGTDETHTDYRMTRANDLEHAYELAKEWFPGNYPESELISIIAYETIGDVKNPIVLTDNKEFKMSQLQTKVLTAAFGTSDVYELAKFSDEHLLQLPRMGKMFIARLRRYVKENQK